MAQDHVFNKNVSRKGERVLCQPAVPSTQNPSTWEARLSKGRNQEKKIPKPKK